MTSATQAAARERVRRRRLAILKSRRCPRCEALPVKMDAEFRPDGAIIFKTQCTSCNTDMTTVIPASETIPA